MMYPINKSKEEVDVYRVVNIFIGVCVLVLPFLPLVLMAQEANSVEIELEKKESELLELKILRLSNTTKNIQLLRVQLKELDIAVKELDKEAKAQLVELCEKYSIVENTVQVSADFSILSGEPIKQAQK